MLSKKNKAYFKKMISKLNAMEMLALMEAISEYGIEMMAASTSLQKLKPMDKDSVDVQ